MSPVSLPTARYRTIFSAGADAAGLSLPPFSVEGPQTDRPSDWPDRWIVPGDVLLEAIALHESVGDARARRYEPHQDRRPDSDTLGEDDGDTEDDASYGLMQIMGYTARDLLGIPQSVLMDWRLLYRPMLNVSLATTLLCRLARQRSREVVGIEDVVPIADAVLIPLVPLADVVLARYNGGARGNPDIRGELRTAGYVEKVREAARLVMADRKKGA